MKFRQCGATGIKIYAKTYDQAFGELRYVDCHEEAYHTTRYSIVTTQPAGDWLAVRTTFK
jgi:hypothetical protein